MLRVTRSLHAKLREHIRRARRQPGAITQQRVCPNTARPANWTRHRKHLTPEIERLA